MKGTCEICGQGDRFVGPFRFDDGRHFERVCGPCKLRITMTPERWKSLEREIRHAVEVVDAQSPNTRKPQ